MQLTLDTMNNLLEEALRRKDGIAVRLPSKKLANNLRFKLYKRRAAYVRSFADLNKRTELFSLMMTVDLVGDSWHLAVKKSEPTELDIVDGGNLQEQLSEIESGLMETNEVVSFDEEELKDDNISEG